jgi:hypothetical protein
MLKGGGKNLEEVNEEHPDPQYVKLLGVVCDVGPVLVGTGLLT